MDNNELLALCKAEAAHIDQAMRADLGTIQSSLLAEVVTHGIFNGGKRIRPLLTVLSARLCPVAEKRDEERLRRLAMVFEYLHAASLLHDDVIDHAEQRRGHDTANKVWGNTPVILAGDFLHTRAMLLAGTCGGIACLEIISRTTAAMVEAEFLQMQNARSIDLSEENYFAVLEGKTAALIAAACEVGIVFAHGTPDQGAAMHTYGANLGLAFQIVDDLLDYLGDPRETGKAVGNDFTEGKMTLPLLHTLQKAPAGERDELFRLLAGAPTERAAHIKDATALIDRHGGFEYARETAERLIRTALDKLHLFADSPAREMLAGLSQYVLTRKK